MNKDQLINTEKRAGPDAWFAFGFIVSPALSISATQIFAGLLFIWWVIQAFRNRQPWQSFRTGILSHTYYKTAFLFFGWLAVSAAAVVFSDRITNRPDYIAGLIKTELADFALLAASAGIFFTARRHPKIIEKALVVFAVLVVISGLASLFSEARLAKVFTGKAAEAFSASNRPQFPFAFAGFELYRPVGFMNTRLSYANLLLFSFWILISQLLKPEVLKSLREKNLSPGSVLKGITVFAVLFLLYANAARSVQAGLIISVILFAVSFFTSELRTGSVHRKKFLITAGVAAALVIAALSLQIEHTMTRHTDYMRPVIWHEAFSLFQKFPLTGTGPGMYTTESLIYRESTAWPHLYYFYSIVPSSHAHNDFLHAAAVAGLPGLVLFSLMVYSIVVSFLNCQSTQQRALLASLPGFFTAGLFQCYFQDDESVTVFWIVLAAYSAGIVRRTGPVARATTA